MFVPMCTRLFVIVGMAALVAGSLGVAPSAVAAEPVVAQEAPPSKLTAFKIRWIEKRREQQLRERLLRTDRLAPRLQTMANALWRDNSQNGFSLDVDPGDEEVILHYRVRF
jgi:hypothetical protein